MSHVVSRYPQQPLRSITAIAVALLFAAGMSARDGAHPQTAQTPGKGTPAMSPSRIPGASTPQAVHSAPRYRAAADPCALLEHGQLAATLGPAELVGGTHHDQRESAWLRLPVVTTGPVHRRRVA
jgi:hypothetical protein